jgi:hypothetical protein
MHRAPVTANRTGASSYLEFNAMLARVFDRPPVMPCTYGDMRLRPPSLASLAEGSASCEGVTPPG